MQNKKTKWFVRVVAIVLACCLIYCGYNLIIQIRVYGGSSAEYNNPIEIEDDASLNDIAKECLKATVAVYTADESGNKSLCGSGVAIHANGYIATNYHVILDCVNENSGKSLSIKTNDATFYSCKLLWYNEMLDVAVIKTEKNANIEYLPMKDRWINCKSNEKLIIMERFIAIGTPLNEVYFNTVTTGYLASESYRTAFSSSKAGGIQSTRYCENLIQHTCAIKNGNSGGPLIDMHGNVVGLNTFSDGTVSGKRSDDCIYMSVPIYPIMLVIDQIVKNYDKGVTRLTMYDLPVTYYDKTYTEYNPTVYTYNGDYVYVSSDKDGLLSGDEIMMVTVDGKEYSINSRNSLYFALLKASNKEIEVSVVRNGVEKKVKVNLV